MRHWSYLTTVMEDNRRRNEINERRFNHLRALKENRVIQPSLLTKFKSKLTGLQREDHTLTNYPCRLPNGRIGRVSVLNQNSDWVLVCKAA